MAERGLVIGKFYPPHRGHKFLIDTARSQVDHLTVIVCDKAGQTIPGALRGEWLRETHPDVEVLVIPDTLPEDDSAAWAENTRAVLGYVPDVVFTSEDYGDAYARYLGCRHVLVDRTRSHVPISATTIRADPWAHRVFLEPCVRAYFVKRVALFGAESSGTTTLTRALAEQYHTVWVPEYGREYAEAKLHTPHAQHWRSEEFLHIAQTQCAWEDAAARKVGRVLFCDTPAFATSLWHERYLGTLSPAVEAVAAPYHYALYFLTDVDIPFVQDGTRDGEHIRHGMHQRFTDWLIAYNVLYTLLSGSLEERLCTAMRLVDTLLV
jgi:HTH-type transcriptional repressor of NAD biosynthesis genes